MKNIATITAIVCSITIIVSCSKSNNNTKLQPHDSNRMMDSMHAMMDKMDMMKMTDDPEIDFTQMMIMHHMGAISMANLELQAGKDDSIKRVATRIITEQQKEIQEFNALLPTLKMDNMDAAFSMEQQSSMDKMSKTADIQFITGDIDNDFATLMIIHHQAAIDNASAYLHHGSNNTLKSMATKIVDAQTIEIAELATWLKAMER